MFRHYLLTVVRNLARQKLVTLMHVAGLSVGIACFIVSFVFIEQLRTSDGKFRNSGRTYAITQQLWMGNAAAPISAPIPIVTIAAAPYLKADFPYLEAVARAVGTGSLGVRGPTPTSTGDRNVYLHYEMVDPDFLRIFDLPIVAGDGPSALASANGAIITEAAARRVFGTTNVLGRRLLVANKTWITIRAVTAGVPQPSHMGDTDESVVRFDVLTRFVPQTLGEIVTDWDSPAAVTYALLPASGALTPEAFRAGLAGFADRHMPRSQGHSRFGAVPISTIRFGLYDAVYSLGKFSMISSLLLLDMLVLIVACFNYANLATATGLRRGREIGLRKVVGASRSQLLVQSFMEAAVLGTIALALALVLVVAARPLLSEMLPVGLQLTQLGRPIFWVFASVLVLVATLLAGAYPALVQSRLRPAQTLRSESGRAGPPRLFRALVAVQFAAAGFLIIMVLIIQAQNRLMTTALPELTRNPTVAITTSTAFMGVNTDTLRTELERSPYVRSVTTADNLPWDNNCCWLFNLTRSPGTVQSQIQVAANQIGYKFFETMGFKLLAGRTLSKEQGDELGQEDLFSGKRQIDVVVDRSFASRFGWSNPADAVGKTVYRPALWGGVPGTLHIVGVVENGAPRLTAIEATKSNLYLLMPASAGYTVVRIEPSHVREALAHIESAWRGIAPHLPFQWRFTDDLFNQAYQTYSTISAVATGITAFAFVIALMGLAGMAIHVTAGRLREIGVRKTLGAQPRQVVELLLIDFAKPIAIANILAWPFAWLAARAYLSTFLTRTEITPVPFLASLAATIAIMCIAVGAQALRAARVEPAMVLRCQ
jgi:putative ABC transport system permease protein